MAYEEPSANPAQSALPMFDDLQIVKTILGAHCGHHKGVEQKLKKSATSSSSVTFLPPQAS